MSDLTHDELRALLHREYNHPFSGWDFSYLHGRRVMLSEEKPWDYVARTIDAVTNAHTMLDMDTGGGEWLSSLPRRPANVHATEGYGPNITVARERLGPLGIVVHDVADAAHLPFDATSFDLVTNRHGAYMPRELARVVNRGGMFITQQVGDQTNRELHDVLGRTKQTPAWNLDLATAALAEQGFEIVEQHEIFPITRYFDIGAVVYYLKAIPWEIPDFDIDRDFDALAALHGRIQREGYLDVRFHLFFIRARKG